MLDHLSTCPLTKDSRSKLSDLMLLTEVIITDIYLLFYFYCISSLRVNLVAALKSEYQFCVLMSGILTVALGKILKLIHVLHLQWAVAFLNIL